jgi:hypothetical protein
MKNNYFAEKRVIYDDMASGGNPAPSNEIQVAQVAPPAAPPPQQAPSAPGTPPPAETQKPAPESIPKPPEGQKAPETPPVTAEQFTKAITAAKESGTKKIQATTQNLTILANVKLEPMPQSQAIV